MRFLSGNHWWSWKRWSKKCSENLTVDQNLSSLNIAKVIINAVLHEFSGESLHYSFDRAYRIIHEDSKTDDFSRTFIHACAYHFLQIGRWKIKEVLKNNKNNSQIHFAQKILGRLICYTDLEKIRCFVKDIYIVLREALT